MERKVRISEAKYYEEHWRNAPKCYGYWFFATDDNSWTFEIFDSYANAKKAARAAAMEQTDAETIYVMP